MELLADATPPRSFLARKTLARAAACALTLAWIAAANAEAWRAETVFDGSGARGGRVPSLSSALAQIPAPAAATPVLVAFQGTKKARPRVEFHLRFVNTTDADAWVKVNINGEGWFGPIPCAAKKANSFNTNRNLSGANIEIGLPKGFRIKLPWEWDTRNLTATFTILRNGKEAAK